VVPSLRGEGSSSSRFAAAAAALALSFLFVASAHAQTDRQIDVQLFLPTPNVGTAFTLDRPGVNHHLTATFGLGLSYAHQPFVRTHSDGQPADDVVRGLMQADVLASLGLFEYLELGLALPVGVAFAETRTDTLLNGPGSSFQYNTIAGLSDLRLSAKVPILRGEVGLAARLVVGLPMGDTPEFLGNRFWTLYPELVFAWDPGPVQIGASLGYRLRQRRALADFEQDDELQLTVGGAVPIITELAIVAEAQLRAGIGGRTGFGGRQIGGAETPMEVDGGLRIRPASGLTIDVGAGTGIVAGYGSPSVRGFALLRYAIEQSSCPGGPEDEDGFQDGDFCLDPDNDADGIEDTVDACPNDAEDMDGFSDDDGCPEVDNDADGIPDASDVCPSQSEDDDDFNDEDGCPEPDNDEDGIADGLDHCPMDPEDRDDFEDEDGCPEPGPRTAAVTVSDTRILIGETVYFEYDTDTIRPVSMPLLDQVAEVISALSPDLRIRVEGHTDSAGTPAYNLDLSFRRARAVVEYLVGRGVARDRLEYRGYGNQHEVAPNDDPDGRALNRRVEFTILRPGEPASVTGTPHRRTGGH
jgi:outer membrane protein OmpA-like peptidoglycan-associated protein